MTMPEILYKYRAFNERTFNMLANNQVYNEYVHNQLGILSLSSCNDSILMWSHYADFHKGFCIGFKTNSLGFQLFHLNAENLACWSKFYS
ncbi:MAG: DUF2971 domain-containing protein [Gammaproteobacteria bacterium]|nr:DUF2971 domain-containing protein [Gammaproteobacteria bacterium]